MKKSLLLCMLASAGLTGRAANSLLTAPVAGALGHSRIAAMSIASNGTDAVLLLSDNKSLYALDIADNKSSEAAANTITSIPDFVNAKLKAVAGGVTLTVIDIEVNPISKAVYVLAEASGTSYVFKVRNNGMTVTLINLSSISHSTITWGGTFAVNDMTWGNNKLYASSGSFSLDGGVATVPAPFAHGTTITQKATSMFKSNWGGSYVTKAPLETMTYGMVKTKHRLMGVTTCAPGFSLDIANLGASGTVQVTEDFNVQYGFSQKVVFQRHDGKDWLFDLHDNNLYRLGETLLDGSPVTAGKHNNKAVVLRSGTDPASGIAADVFKHYTGNYTMISYWDDYRLVVLEDGGTLKLMQTATKAPPLSIDQTIVSGSTLSVYPNPAKDILYVSVGQAENMQLQVFSMDGKLVYNAAAMEKNNSIDISKFASGQYILKAVSAEGNSAEQIFIVQ